MVTDGEIFPRLGSTHWSREQPRQEEARASCYPCSHGSLSLEPGVRSLFGYAARTRKGFSTIPGAPLGVEGDLLTDPLKRLFYVTQILTLINNTRERSRRRQTHGCFHHLQRPHRPLRSCRLPDWRAEPDVASATFHNGVDAARYTRRPAGSPKDGGCCGTVASVCGAARTCC